jgi:hypothetical protein
MSEALEQLVLPTAMLRTAIRAKLRTGTSRQAISALIKAYSPRGASTKRRNGQLYRLPIELIALERRAPFLDALNELPADRRQGSVVRPADDAVERPTR